MFDSLTDTKRRDPQRSSFKLRLLIARIAWIAIVCAAIGLFLSGAPAPLERRGSDANALGQRWATIIFDDSASNPRTMTALEGLFTPSLETVGPIHAEVTYVGRGCSGDLPYPVDPSGTIALLDAGQCRFDNKVHTAEQAGAIAAIVADQFDSRADRVSPMQGRPLAGIPAVRVNRADGLALRETENGGRPTVTLAFASAEPSALGRFGISRELYALYGFVLDSIALPLLIAIGFLIFWRRADDWFAWLASLTLVPGVRPHTPAGCPAAQIGCRSRSVRSVTCCSMPN